MSIGVVVFMLAAAPLSGAVVPGCRVTAVAMETGRVGRYSPDAAPSSTSPTLVWSLIPLQDDVPVWTPDADEDARRAGGSR